MSGIVGQNRGRGSGLIKASAIDDNAVTLAKMAGLARGTLIYGDASGDPAALAAGGADEVLTHDGTDFDWAAAGGGGGGITDIEQWRITSSATGTFPNGLTDNWARVAYNDTVYGYYSTGSGITESSGVFTFSSTGFWKINFTADIYGKADDRIIYIRGETTTNDGSSWSQTGNIAASSVAATVFSDSSTGLGGTWERILDITDTSNQKIKFCVEFNFGGTSNVVSSSTTATFMKLGDT
jgi:hypothetical protein|tara:strand:- start:574 stop:1290 length:717 start_codon:yes stop_codon:yes gene_type:complete